MELSRLEYPSLLGSIQPAQAVLVLEERVRLIGKVNTEIADWLLERRRVEDAYAQGLRKLAGKRLHDVSYDVGIFRTPLKSIVSSTESLAQSHSILAQNIEVDIEKPLREYQTKNKEMRAMTTIQGNLASIAKDLEVAQKRAEKVKGGKSSTKIANATSDVDIATQQWESQAPYVFEQLQALDENRLNYLRDILTQLETHAVDQVERNRVNAESCLNALLNLNTSEEISAFVAKTSGGRPPLTPRQKSQTAPAGGLRPTTPAHGHDDRASELSAISTGATRSAQSPPQERRFGLKRLGTMIIRTRQTSKPLDHAGSPEKRLRPSLNPLRRGTSTRDMQTIPSPQGSAVNLPPPPLPPPPQIDPTHPDSQRKTGFTDPEPLSSAEPRRVEYLPNGDALQPPPVRSSSLPGANGIIPAPPSMHPDESQPAGLRKTPAESQLDSDGFNVPPPANDDISRAQDEAALSESEPQLKLDIRQEPIPEEDGAAQSAFSNVANTLRAQAQQIATPRKPSASRGRRDVRNTIFVPSPQPPELSAFSDSPMPLPASFNPSRSSTFPSEMPHSSDAQSIRSSHSLSSLMNNTVVKHPEMTQPGLNASIVETVSADFSHGQVIRSTVTGEIALAHNPGDTSSTSGHATIRLENFPVLEKVAPNPAFITQLPSRSGEYSADLSQLSRTSIAFKYKVHLDASQVASHAPINLVPTWKIKLTQASVILNYSFNTAFVSPLQRSVTLQNVVVLVNIEKSKALSCLSKPVGIFSKERSMIYWKLGDIRLDAYAEAPQKLLARFTTEADVEALAGTVEVRWEISGEHSAGLGSGLGLSILSGMGGQGGTDPFADEGLGSDAWKSVEVARKLASGKYIAN